MTQSRRNAVTQVAICTWVARLRPSDRGAIAVITCAITPTLIRNAARRWRCLGWRVDRNAPPGRQANCCCAASAHHWAVASPVRRAACARRCSRGVRARECSRPSRRSEAPPREPTANALAPSLGTGDTSAMAAAKRKPAAKKPAAKKAAAKKPAVKKPARARVDLHCSSSRHLSFSTHRPRRSRRRRSAERRPDAISMLFP